VDGQALEAERSRHGNWQLVAVVVVEAEEAELGRALVVATVSTQY